MRTAAALLGGLLYLVATVTPAQAGQPQTLAAIAACFVTEDSQHPVTLEVARTPSERRTGLMWRAELPANSGMLFSYPQERSPDSGFWMHNTLIPLDIAFLNSEGVIVSIEQMEPCASRRQRDCPTYPAGRFFWHAVEMNAGYLSARNIKTGDRLAWPASGGQCE